MIEKIKTLGLVIIFVTIYSNKLSLAVEGISNSNVRDSTNCEKYNAAIQFILHFGSERLQQTSVNFFYDSIDIIDDCQTETANGYSGHNSFTHTILSPIVNYTSNVDEKANKKASHLLQNFHQRSKWVSVNVFILKSRRTELIPSSQLIREVDYNFIIQVDAEQNGKNATNTNDDSIMLEKPLSTFKFKVEILLEKSNNSENAALRLITVCFYCNAGNPEIQTVFQGLNSTEVEPPTVLQIFPDLTNNFHGRHLSTMAGKGIRTLNRFKLDETGKLVSSGGFQMKIIENLQEKLNFDLNITESSFGLKQADTGLFNGMIGEVQADRAEIGVGAAVTLDRHEAVYFLTSNTIQFITFVTTLPKAKTKWQAIFRSFTPNSWSFIFVTCYCFLFPAYTASYLIFHHVQKKRKKKDTREKSYVLFDAVGEGLGFIMRPLLEQPFSSAQVLRSGGGVILFLSWMFSAIIFGTAYKSILMSNMVSPLFEESPDTYAELAAAKDYKIYLHYVGGALPKLFNESRSSIFQDLSKRLILEKSIFKCIDYTLKSKAACLSYRDNLGAEVNRNFSDRYGKLLIKKASDTAFNLPVSILLPKNAVYKDAMNSIVRQQIDMGITDHYVNYELKLALDEGKAWAKVRPDAIPANEHNGPVSLSIGHFLSSFSLLAFGACLGFIVLVIELLTKSI